LVDERNSPFNVCSRIETDDLTLEDATTLWHRVSEEDPGAFVEQAYDLVGGQPYLLQTVFAELDIAELPDREDVFNERIDNLRVGADDHFMAMFRRVLSDQALTQIVQRLVRDGNIQNEPASADFKFAQVVGIARRDSDRLVFRNQLYAAYAGTVPQLADDSAALRPVGRPGRIPLPSDNACDFMTDTQYEEIALSSYQGAVSAYNRGSYRLALVGFGIALEAVLVEWLLSLTTAELSAKVNDAQRHAQLRFEGRENQNDAATWRLVTLEKVARANPTAVVPHIQVPQSLRDLRNLVHPAKAVTHYHAEPALEPEARSASGMLDAALRDVRANHR
jgi:hypothetical protein